MWQPAQRNFDKIQFEKLRKKVDITFNAAHDKLSDCYYNYWKKGNSKPFRGYDVQPTREESKRLFDKLHGLIFQLRELKFHSENLKQPAKDRIPEEKYNIIFDSERKPIGKRVDAVILRVEELRKEGIELEI